MKKFSVKKYLIEVNYNDYLYHLADDMQRIGCDRHFSDNDLVRFIRRVGVKDPTIITIHGSNRLSADAYTKKIYTGQTTSFKSSGFGRWKKWSKKYFLNFKKLKK